MNTELGSNSPTPVPGRAVYREFQFLKQCGEGATDVSAAMELTEIQAVAPSEVGGQTAGEGAAGLVDTLPPGFRLGRFRLLEPLGQGGWGTVYRAEDTADGSQVAIKLSRRRSGDRHGLARFRKEARLLAEIDSPYAARFIDANESQGIHYLVMEFVAGKSLARLIHEHQRLDEHTAISIVADACRGLTEAHRRGIVHRGIKPDNIIVQCPDRAEPSARGSVSNRIEPPPPALRAKLVDFGLARHMIEPASLQLTGPGTLLGTPLYMAPEQCSGNAVQPEADIYALGATLFHALAGRPPFIGSDIWSVISQHCRDPPPRLQDIRADVSQGVCRLISKALAKTPAGRYAGAGAMLEELECLLRGEAMTFEAHPRLPACDQSRVLQYVFTWPLKASPSQLWPHVTNTQRLNQALGLPAVEFHAQVDEGGVAQFAETRVAGMRVAWREHPFEWIEGRRFSVLREFNQGPFKWFFSAVDLDALDDGGTRLTHHVQIEPRSILGRIAAAIEIGLKARRGLESAYRHIDATVTQSESTRDPFQPSPKLGVLRRQRLSKLIARLREQGQNPAVLQCLEQFIGQGPAQELARIRPLALAQRFGLDAHEVVEACLHAAREGLLVLLWDILCPVCRIPATVIDTLRAVRDHASCQACQLDFETDFANSIEMIFRPAPHIREVDLKTYCLGGPSHSPHVVVQVRLAPQERLQVDLSLQEGEYRIRGSRLPATLDFEVRPYGTADRWEVRLGGAASDRAPCLRINRQELKLLNDLPHELLVRIERTATRRDALTAARATAMAVFRKLFPAEVLSPQQLLSVGTMTFLAWEARATTAQGRLDADQLADGIALAQALRFANAMVNCVSAHRGAVFKSLGQPAWAVFDDPELAVRAALGMVSAAGSDAPMPTRTLRVAIHTGPAMAATVNDQLEYFGPTLNTLTELIQCARGGELILSESVTSDPGADLLLREVGPAGPIEDWTSADQRTMVIHRLQAASAV